MPRESGDAHLPAHWMRNARGDMAMARIDLPEDATYEQLCFHAQQAAEKSLKALLTHLGIDFPYTHNIGLLVSLLPSDMQSVSALSEAVILTPFAVLTRYPGRMDPVTQDQYAEAVQTASAVVDWVSAFIMKKP